MNVFTELTGRDSQIYENKLMVTKGERWGGRKDKLGGWINIYTLLLYIYIYI